MLKNFFNKLLKKPSLLVYVYKRYKPQIEEMLDVLDNYRTKEIPPRKFDFTTPTYSGYGYTNHKKYKYIDLIEKLSTDTRKYRTYKCDSPTNSVNGFLRIMNKYDIYDVDENWDIYIPSGYNKIEIELEKLQPTKSDQIIFGIQGCDDLVGKTSVWNLLEKKHGRDMAKTIMPETFVIENEEHMNMFKEKYKEGETYILKKKLQRKQGLLLTKDLEEILKAKDKEYTLIQNYKKNVLLVNKRKLNLRIYLLLTVKNGVLEAHVNNYGTCIYNNKDYDADSLDFERNITSFNLDLKIYEKNPLTFKQLNTYLSENGYENPKILFDRINEKVKLLCDAVKDSLGKGENLKDNLCVQIFGMDFIVDTDLNPYLLECNKGPDMSPKINTTFTKLINDLEDFYMVEKETEKVYPSGYKSGNGLKVQRDMFKYLDIIDLKSSNNGFYKVY
jgi:hypothetical protein